MKTNWLKRTLKAPARYRTGKGFGVHSPFAFKFITRVLRETLPFYAYSNQKIRYRDAERNSVKHPFLTLKRIRLLFRTANFFCPESVLQLGADNGLVSAALLDVNSAMKIARCGCDGTFESQNVTEYAAIDALPSDMVPEMVIVVDTEKSEAVENFLQRAVEAESVIVFPCIDHKVQIKELWDALNASAADYGMTFTNDKFGVLVAKKNLPRQHYNVWL